MEKKYCVYCMEPITDAICDVCGKDNNNYQAAVHYLQPGTILEDRYLLGSVLGAGGFGITYVGRDLKLDMKIAIKEYYPTGMVNRNNTVSSDISIDAEDSVAFVEKGKKSFLGEARVLAKFCNEPNVVSVRDFFECNNTAYIVMDLLEGIDMQEYLKKNGPMSFKECVDMLAPVMKVLSKVHDEKLVHRDISPANIFVLNDGTVKLLDFGAMRECNEENEKTLSVVLKPGYAPEEQYRTKGHQGPWTDVYAMSATMYKLITGVTPENALNRVFEDELKGITELNSGVTTRQEDVICKGMAIKAENRYQTVRELLEACEVACASEPDIEEDDERTISLADLVIESEEERTVSKPLEKPVQIKTEIKNIQKQKIEKRENNTEDKAEDSATKKLNVAALILSFLSGCASLYWLYLLLVNIALLPLEYEIKAEHIIACIFFLVIVAVFVGLTIFIGRFYFSRFDNKNRKPNKLCLIMSILACLPIIYFAVLSVAVFSEPYKYMEGDGARVAAMSLVLIAFPIYFGYFYYPRLERKIQKKYIKIYTTIAAVVAVLVVGGIVWKSLDSVTIGDKNYKRNSTELTIHLKAFTDKDIERLKEFKKLESLNIYSAFMDDSDVKIIGELTQLKQLSIAGNMEIKDVTPLKNLKNLTYLDISSTGVEDISCLSGLSQLETFRMSSTHVTDLHTIQGFSKLKTLYVDYLPEADFSNVVLPSTVETLSCCGCGIDNLEFVTTSDSLKFLFASGNEISDVSPLSKFDELYSIDLSVNCISDISSLPVSYANEIDLSTNKIKDISVLKEATSLSNLDLAYNMIEDISALENLYKLYQLSVNNNRISDISPLKECFDIFSLDISFNNIEKIDAITTMDGLYAFSARGNRIKDITPLAECEKMIEKARTIELRDNEISDISALAAYVNTEHMYLSGNKISDLTPLKSCTKLTSAYLNNNNISDISPLGISTSLGIVELVGNPINDLEGLSLKPVDTIFGPGTALHISYAEGADYTKLGWIENFILFLYDTPARQKKELEEYEYIQFVTTINNPLDEIEENPDIATEETEESNG